jgi:hypothetical protein
LRFATMASRRERNGRVVVAGRGWENAGARKSVKAMHTAANRKIK